jgi:ABC-type phosphate transport system substrate-binding protein
MIAVTVEGGMDFPRARAPKAGYRSPKVMRKTSVLLAAVAALAPAAFPPSALADKSAGPVAFIVNARNPVSDISSAEIRKIYLGEETRWSGKGKITILVLPAGREERRILFGRLLKMSDDDYVRHWIAKVFQGDATSGPKTASTAGSMEKLVGGLPDAIGFLAHDDISAASTATLKVLKVDGKSPGDAGYPFAP